MTKNAQKEIDPIEVFDTAMENPLTGRIIMMGSAVRFQNACMSLIEDYQKRGIEEVPISLLEEFIMQSTSHAFHDDVLGNVDGIEKLFEKLKEIK